MSRRRLALVALIVFLMALLACAAWWRLFGVPRWLATSATSRVAATSTPAPEALVPKIKTRLFYVAEDGLRLASVERDIPYARQTADQAREIVNAQIAPVPPPLVSAIPPGTTLRALYIAPKGDAYVDLSQDVATAHPGGSQNRLLNQFAANATGRPVVAGPVEATAAGNILMQMLAVGQIASLREGRALVRRSFPVETYEPQETRAWADAYQQFVKLM